MGMQLHQVAVEPLLNQIGIQYTPEQKFKGEKDLNLGIPAPPDILKYY
jgi:heterodisulfide reductase subunit B